MVKQYAPPDTSYWLTISGDKATKLNLDSLLVNTAKPPAEKKGEDFLDSIINDKEGFLTGSISKMLCLQQERIRLSQDMQKRIDYEICYSQYLISQLDFWPVGAESMAASRRTQIESSRTDLEQEKRREEVACWQDMLKTDQDLRQLLREYLELRTRKKLLKST